MADSWLGHSSTGNASLERAAEDLHKLLAVLQGVGMESPPDTARAFDGCYDAPESNAAPKLDSVLQPGPGEDLYEAGASGEHATVQVYDSAGQSREQVSSPSVAVPPLLLGAIPKNSATGSVQRKFGSKPLSGSTRTDVGSMCPTGLSQESGYVSDGGRTDIWSAGTRELEAVSEAVGEASNGSLHWWEEGQRMAEELWSLRQLVRRQEEELVQLRSLVSDAAECQDLLREREEELDSLRQQLRDAHCVASASAARDLLSDRDEELESLREQLRDAHRAASAMAQSAGTTLGSIEHQLKQRTDEVSQLRVHCIEVEQELEIVRAQLREAEQSLEIAGLRTPLPGDAVLRRTFEEGPEQDITFQAMEPGRYSLEQPLEEHDRFHWELSPASGTSVHIRNDERSAGLRIDSDDMPA